MNQNSFETARVVVYPFGSHINPEIGDGRAARISCDAEWQAAAVLLLQVAYPQVSEDFVASLNPEDVQVFLLPKGEQIDDAGEFYKLKFARNAMHPTLCLSQLCLLTTIRCLYSWAVDHCRDGLCIRR